MPTAAAVVLLRTVVVDMAAVATATQAPPVQIPGGKSIVVSRRGLFDLIVSASTGFSFFGYDQVFKLPRNAFFLIFRSGFVTTATTCSRFFSKV